jgi:hypothetical protein
MALQYRKTVRDAVLSLLQANFNTTLSGLAAAYGIDPFAIDFTSGSTNFAVSHIDPSNIERCQFTEFPAACLYTSDAADNGETKNMHFCGQVQAHIDFYVRDKDGVEGFDTESLFDAIEDAVLTLLNDQSNQWPAGVIFARNTRMQRQTLVPLGEGLATYIPITTVFEVYVP